MPDYQWAVKKGRLITADYDRKQTLNSSQVKEEIYNALSNLFDNVQVESVSDEFKEVYEVSIPRDNYTETIYITAKGTTPGGRSNLQNEQRIQQKAKYLNFAVSQKDSGYKSICLGIYKYNSAPIFCAWNLNHSSAAPDTPISKQIKITTIASALVEGFAQQLTGTGDYVCAFRSDFIYFYIKNSSWLHTKLLSTVSQTQDNVAENNKQSYISTKQNVANNILFYGVPGAGKSHAVDSIIVHERSERIVFHPDYTYSDFVGQILPRVVEDKLKYVFEPGPFVKILKKAVEDSEHMYYLVIEEINRGNAPAIFGDIFQLLDRNDDGSGKYHISNFEIATNVYGDEQHEIIMPANLTILATMNTSDQNIFTLDTAFQRRWEMHMISNDVTKAIHADMLIEGSNISWGKFADVTNDEIIKFGDDIGMASDKRLGAYFAKTSELSRNKFPEKVFKYLWDDVFKIDRTYYFNENISSLEDLINIFRDSSTSQEDVMKRVLQYSTYMKMMNRDQENGNGEDDITM